MVQIKVPIMYGTMSKGINISSLVVQAVRFGYTSIDTANTYGEYIDGKIIPDEERLAEAIQQLKNEGFARDSFWIQTKYTFPGQWSEIEVTEESIRELIIVKFNESKARLGTNIDSYILHSPYQ